MSTKNENNATSTNRVEEQRFEFILYINDHIICQRYFNIRDYNEDCLNSYELKELMDNIAGMNNEYSFVAIHYHRAAAVHMRGNIFYSDHRRQTQRAGEYTCMGG